MDDSLDVPTWTPGPGDRTEPGLPPDSFHPEKRELDRQPDAKPSRLRGVAIWLFAIFCFFFFLTLKLPEARIQNYIIAEIRILAQEQGFLFSAEKVRIGLLLGPSIKLYNVELKSLDNERDTIKVSYLKIRPKLLSIFSSVKKVGLSAELLEGSIGGTVGASTKGELAVDLELDSLDLSATTLLKKFLPIELRAKIDGTIKLDFDPADVQKSEGKIKLAINQLVIPAQNVSGFPLPKLQISESKIDVAISHGKLDIHEFDVGKEGKSDDIVGKLTGEGTLNRMLDRSTINAKATFSLSQGVVKSFPLLGAMLSSARTADGKYSYRLTGPMSALEPVPGG